MRGGRTIHSQWTIEHRAPEAHCCFQFVAVDARDRCQRVSDPGVVVISGSIFIWFVVGQFAWKQPCPCCSEKLIVVLAHLPQRDIQSPNTNGTLLSSRSSPPTINCSVLITHQPVLLVHTPQQNKTSRGKMDGGKSGSKKQTSKFATPRFLHERNAILMVVETMILLH